MGVNITSEILKRNGRTGGSRIRYIKYIMTPQEKYYVLDMFPLSSGAGLHVRSSTWIHCFRYLCRFKDWRASTYCTRWGMMHLVCRLNSMLLSTAYTLAVSTEANINNFRSQLDKIGFCYDWDREVNTSKPEYYKWTQWLFWNSSAATMIQRKTKQSPLLNWKLSSWPMVHYHQLWTMIPLLQQNGNTLMIKRSRRYWCTIAWPIAPMAKWNWCEALGTVLANDEVINGWGERRPPGGKRRMRQWYLRITAYADRLLEGLNSVDFSDSMKKCRVTG